MGLSPQWILLTALTSCAVWPALTSRAMNVLKIVAVLPSRKRANVEFAGVRPLHQSEFVCPNIIEIQQALQQEKKSVD